MTLYIVYLHFEWKKSCVIKCSCKYIYYAMIRTTTEKAGRLVFSIVRNFPSRFAQYGAFRDSSLRKNPTGFRRLFLEILRRVVCNCFCTGCGAPCQTLVERYWSIRVSADVRRVRFRITCVAVLVSVWCGRRTGYLQVNFGSPNHVGPIV